MPKPTPPSDAVRVVDALLTRAIQRQASDVHFEPLEDGLIVRFRLDGLLHEVDRFPAELSLSIIARLKVLAGLLTYRLDIPQEGAFSVQKSELGSSHSLDIRISTFPTVRGERAVARLLYQISPVAELEALGLSHRVVSELQSAGNQPSGLILLTGPSGSGKTTTLYAIARHILTTTPGRSVVSLEDPVEQRVAGMTQIQITPHGELDYPRAMRSMLRQDVEVLLVGEIRDAQTAHIVIEAALTGHLILSTLHSGDPGEAIVRLLEMGIAPYQLVGALSVVCSQRLLRRRCMRCRDAGDESACTNCAGTGYLGRTACGQIAVVKDTLRDQIISQAPVCQLRRVIDASCPSLIEQASDLVAQGETTAEEARRVLGTVNSDNLPGISTRANNGRAQTGAHHALV